MIILAIETSCDDTCIAIVEAKGQKRPRFDILSNIVSSQVEIHRKWGGVYPTLAKREHEKNLVPTLLEALKKAKNPYSESSIQTGRLTKSKNRPKIDLIAVTAGPGLDPCLWTGINFAKKLAKDWNLPIIPVNHIESHILVNFIDKQPTFPAIALVVSGGHTQLILVKDIGRYKILGETRDDAAGECFDKVAKILGLEYPGGPIIAANAAKFSISNFQFSIKLPRPMINQKNYDFSFSGLKTAVLYNFKTQPQKIKKSKKYIREMCKETQQAIIDVLIKKTIKAAKDYRTKTIILGGGVSANKELRKQFIENCKLKIENCNFLVPPKNLCTDNAVMIGIAGYFNWLKKKTKPWQKIKADANLRIC